jgi:hypothetical protein
MLALAVPLTLTSRHFTEGCLNPGVVLSRRPDLIAVMTNLSLADRETHACIKELRHPLGRLCHKAAAGDRNACAAMYGPGTTRGRWLHFPPVAVGCASRAPAETRRCLESIPGAQWQALEGALRQVPVPYCPGLYPVAVPLLAGFDTRLEAARLQLRRAQGNP